MYYETDMQGRQGLIYAGSLKLVLYSKSMEATEISEAGQRDVEACLSL